MKVEQIRPAAALAPFVDRYWCWESGPGETVVLPTLLPGTGAELFFHYGDPFACLGSPESSPLPHNHLMCVRRKPMALAPATGVGFVAVRLRSGMLHRFTDVPGAELADRHWPPAELWGAQGGTLAEQVREAGSLRRRVELIERFLLGRLALAAPDLAVERAMDLLYYGQASPIDELACRCGLGRRQLERRVRAVAGLAPAELRRIARLHKTVRALVLAPALAPLDAALDHGYFDQPHFNRDFRELAGTTLRRHLERARAAAHFYNPPSGRATGR